MRHLLFLAHRIPFPPDKGDKIRSYHILRWLSSRFKIHLGCFFDDAADLRHVNPLRDLCEEVFCLQLGRAQKTVRTISALALRRSVSESCYRDPRMKSWVSATLASHDIRDIFVFCSMMAPYVAVDRAGRHIVLDLVDVDSEKWASYARLARWPLRTLYDYEQRHVLGLERRVGAACDHLLFVSAAEADAFQQLAPELSRRVGYLENGVDLDRFDPAQSFCCPFDGAAMPIVFTGAMDYRANIDAVEWFARAVLPSIRRAHPRAEFWIVGGNPASAVRRLSRQAGIVVTGAVVDVRPYLAHADCAVAPLRIARGVQNKVLEAMAMAKPVVLTPAALEGLHATPGSEVLLASNGADFARCVSEILSGRWEGLGRAARAHVGLHHRWTQNLKTLDGLFPDPPDSTDFRAIRDGRPHPAKAIG